MYENQKGTWRGVSGVYQDLKMCEADAKALSEKNQAWTGCAVPPEVTTVEPPAGADGPTSNQVDANNAAFARDAKLCGRSSQTQQFIKQPGTATILGTEQAEVQLREVYG
jgi:hypothetical protein